MEQEMQELQLAVNFQVFPGQKDREETGIVLIRQILDIVHLRMRG